MIKDVIKLRHLLHQNPEVSNNEYKTSETIIDYFKQFEPDKIIRLSKTGIAFIFEGKESGKTTMFRAELDALPINETSNRSYSSNKHNIAHSCGHDGHMAILAGLAEKVAKNRPQKGKTILLFQPAEEVEQGAKDVVDDLNFKLIEPDYIFALHNIPGEEANQILIKNGSFAAASKGMTIKLFGKTSHAAEPEFGISPANAISFIINKLNTLSNNSSFSDLTILTIIHIVMGEISFGTSPGYAELRATLRAFENVDMTLLTELCEQIIEEVSNQENLKFEISYNEVFPATVNDPFCAEIITASAKKLNIMLKNTIKPYKWSEDFAYFTEKYNGCLFGLGSGINHPQLHNSDYDFPDDIIETGIEMFYAIYQKLNFTNDE